MPEAGGGMSTVHATTRRLLPDAALLAACWQSLVRPGDVHEVRAPKTRRGPLRLFGVASGYFDDDEAFLEALSEIGGEDAEGVYLTLNPVNPALLARAANRLIDGKPITTSDADIVRRRHLLIDFDPVRPSGISATNEERTASLIVREAVLAYLTNELGWPPPVASVETGNGAALIYRIRLANDEPARLLVEGVLRGLAAAFNTERVTVDTTNANAARIVKVVGTVAAKGDSTTDRPWRLATATFQPAPLPVSDGQLAAVAAMAPPIKQGKTQASMPDASWEVRDLLRARGIGWSERAKPWGTVLELDRCLTSDDHTDAACIIEFPSGALAYRCLHNRCADKTWADVRGILGVPKREPYGAFTVGGKAAGDRDEHVRSSASSHGHPPPNEPSEDVAFAPTPIPDVAYYGWFREYVDLVEPTTEGAPAFHLASALALTAATMGRRICTIYASDELYANLFCLLIGPAGRAKKDTAIKRALKIPQLPGPGLRMHSVDFEVLRDIGSDVGLVSALKDHNNILLYITEFKKLMGYARRQSTNTIIPRLIEAFDTPPILQNKVKGNPLEAKLPYLTLIAAIQPDILTEQMSEGDISSGFANRLMYFVGTGTGPKPSAPNLDSLSAWQLFDDLTRAIGSYPDGTVLPMLEEARPRWDAWYVADYNRPVANEDEDTMHIRLAVMIRKVALIYAVSEAAPGIGDRHIAAAIALIEWMWVNMRRLIRTWGEAPEANLQRKIIETLDRNGPMLRRKLQQNIGHRMGPGVFARVVKAMLENGTLGMTEDRRLTLITDDDDD